MGGEKFAAGLRSPRSLGITPAWAGKRPASIPAHWLRRDHPRVGGEKGLRFPAFFTREGSPPRGRGKVTHGEEVLKGERITPAWAGKSSFCHVCQVFDQDHPRVGGEKLRVALWRLDTRGSPPRGRGKATRKAAPMIHTRITPAWAGKRSCTVCLALAVLDHPRVGGEKAAPLMLWF